MERQKDEEEFEALCNVELGDAIYHRNRLYQPLHGQAEEEDEEESLSFPELQYLDSMSQLTGMLEEEESDEVRDCEDQIDRLQMSNFIDSLESFHGSPLIDHRDPLMMEEIQGQKPDSTIEMLPKGDCEQADLSSSASFLHSQDNHFPGHHQPTTLIGGHHSPQNQFYLPFLSNNDTCNSINKSQTSDKIQDNNLHEFSFQDKNSESGSYGQQQLDCHHVSSMFDLSSDENLPDSFELREVGRNKRRNRTLQEDNSEEDQNNQTNKTTTKSRTKRKFPQTGSENLSSFSDSSASNKTNNFYKTNDNEYQEEHIHKKLRIDQLIEGSKDNHDQDSIMSEDKRSTANARERVRMGAINQAFDKLREKVPAEMIERYAKWITSDQAGGRRGSRSGFQAGESQPIKLTKMNILRIATSYIDELTKVLKQQLPEGEFDRIRSIVPISKGQPSAFLKNRRGEKSSSRRKSRKSETSQSRGSVPEEKLQNKEKHEELGRVALNEQASKQPIIITNQYQAANVAAATTTLLPAQPQKHQQLLSHCAIRPPLTLSQTPSIIASQDGSFVTPVAVAILGIPTNGAQANLNEPRALQILGVQGAAASGNQQQSAGASYNLVGQHPQHVTLTLNDVNGLPVLRLANQNALTGGNNAAISIVNPTSQQQQPAFQLQQNRPSIIVHQQPQLLANVQNYATYQPIQISQLQATNPNNQMGSPNLLPQGSLGALQFHNGAGSTFSENNSLVSCSQQKQAFDQLLQRQHISSTNDKLMTIKSIESHTTITGINSDRRNYVISPMANLITAQHLNNNNNNIINNNNIHLQATQQSNYSSQLIQVGQQNCRPGQLLAIKPINTHDDTHVQAQNFNSAAQATPSNGKTNTIYMKQVAPNEPQQPSEHRGSQFKTGAEANTTGSRQQFEQMKFVNQFQRQLGDSKSSNEANISELVASLATSIHPNSKQSAEMGASEEQNCKELAQKQQQQKRTYRFHNYDGNMITNNLYGTQQQDRQQGQLFGSGAGGGALATTTSKGQKADQEQANSQSLVVGQRSRQNSLSSTCSTYSSSSSFLISSSSPTMMKSPVAESDSRS